MWRDNANGIFAIIALAALRKQVSNNWELYT